VHLSRPGLLSNLLFYASSGRARPQWSAGQPAAKHYPSAGFTRQSQPCHASYCLLLSPPVFLPVFSYLSLCLPSLPVSPISPCFTLCLPISPYVFLRLLVFPYLSLCFPIFLSLTVSPILPLPLPVSSVSSCSCFFNLCVYCMSTSLNQRLRTTRAVD
jgi:hypothetical protein